MANISVKQVAELEAMDIPQLQHFKIASIKSNITKFNVCQLPETVELNNDTKIYFDNIIACQTTHSLNHWAMRDHYGYHCLSYILDQESKKGRPHLERLFNTFEDKTKNNNSSILHVIANSPYKGSACLQKVLSYNICDVNALDDNGSTALHACCLTGDFESIKVLVYNGANINVINNSNYSPLMYTHFLKLPNPEIIKFLIENGAIVNLKSDITEKHYMYGIAVCETAYDYYKARYTYDITRGNYKQAKYVYECCKTLVTTKSINTKMAKSAAKVRKVAY